MNVDKLLAFIKVGLSVAAAIIGIAAAFYALSTRVSIVEVKVEKLEVKQKRVVEEIIQIEIREGEKR